MTESVWGDGSAMSAARFVWLGQAGFAIEGAGHRIVIDPFLSKSPRRAAPPHLVASQLVGADLVLCTHEHADHMDLDTLRILAIESPATLFAAPEPTLGILVAGGIPQSRLIGARDRELVTRTAARVHVVPSEHGRNMDDAYGFGRETPGSPARFVGYVLDLDGVCIYHSGDTTRWPGQDALLRELGVQVALLPINGRDSAREGSGIVGNLDPREAALLASQCGAELIVPMHWDAITGNQGSPSELVAAVAQLGLNLTVLVPGQGKPFWFGECSARERDRTDDTHL